ncbi:unnamed protein product [Effrenium voratum]|uniref:Uncharacterized protein n=1 Tax=Effrenium voratum TaxID=2562239 RepID=A0AA36MUM8_9DINO|nr:unnamed protein product [Effrenium voratum]
MVVKAALWLGVVVWSCCGIRRATVNAGLGWPLDAELALAAAELLERFDDVSTGRSWIHPAGAVWESFRTADHGRHDPLIPPELQVSPDGFGDGRVIENQRGAERGHICLYGIITALFVAYRHAVPRQLEDAHRHLELIMWLLGETQGGEQLFDFIESTSWPVRSIDVELNLEMAKSGPPIRFLLFSRLRSQTVISTVPSMMLSAKPPRCSLGLEGLAVFGVHPATSLEPASAILAAEQALQTSAECDPPQDLKVRFYGHPCPSYSKTGYLCQWAQFVLPHFGQGSQEPDGATDPVAEILSEMVDLADRHIEKEWDLHLAMGKLFKFLQGDSFARSSFWLCSGPAVLCAMLRIADPAKIMLMWHCRHLLDGLGMHSNSTATALLGLLRVMASRSTKCLACEVFVAKQAAWQLAMPEPQVQRRLAIYVEAYSWKGLSARPMEVLVMRSMLWTRLPGMYFKTILEAFVRENREVLPLSFNFATEAGFIPYSEMVLHRCGVLVPNDLTMAAFAEAYTMGFPVFLPEDEWLYRLQKSVPYGFMVHAAPFQGLPNTTHWGSAAPFWYEKTRALTSVMAWLRLSDFSAWPHTKRFDSVPQLLRGLIDTDLRETSAAMRKWMAANKKEGLYQWSGLLASLLHDGAPYVSATSSLAMDPQWAKLKTADVTRNDLLYSALACEHESFDNFGWPTFRAVLEADAAATAEARVMSYNAAMHMFLKNATADKAGLEGRCHLGLACALLLQAWKELTSNDTASKVTWFVGLAHQLMLPLMDVSIGMVPLGTWPVEDIMAAVSAMMEERRVATAGRQLSSTELPAKLEKSAVVEELARTGDRLKYKLLSGTGPEEGWVSVRLKDKVLLEPCGQDDSDNTSFATRLEELREEFPGCADLKVPKEAEQWPDSDLHNFFESGGLILPKPAPKVTQKALPSASPDEIKGPQFAVPEALQLQDKLLKAFKSSEFQQRLKRLQLRYPKRKERGHKDGSAYFEAFEALVMGVYCRVLPDYGLAGDWDGVRDMFAKMAAAMVNSKASRRTVGTVKTRGLLHILPRR